MVIPTPKMTGKMIICFPFEKALRDRIENPAQIAQSLRCQLVSLIGIRALKFVRQWSRLRNSAAQPVLR